MLNIQKWLTEPPYACYAPAVIEHIADQQWQQLDDVFWTTIPFGTGGRRGRMYAIGTQCHQRSHHRRKRQGLAHYVRSQSPAGALLACAVAYDTRHQSRHFAELCAGILVAAGFRVYLLDGFRSTPELSFLVRQKQCHCGIMVTASHNPPSDNAVKVYWSTGGQVLPPHDEAIIRCVQQVDEIAQADFQTAVAQGQIELCTEEVDEAFCATLAGTVSAVPATCTSSILPCTASARPPSARCWRAPDSATSPCTHPMPTPMGIFRTCRDMSPIPRIRAFSTLDRARTLAFRRTADSGHRSGLRSHGLRRTADICRTTPRGPRSTGNQLGALLADYVLERRQVAGTLSPQHYLVKTLVTTELIRRIGDSYGVRTCGDLPVGFKWIGGAIDEEGPEQFVLGCEESHGYLIGQYARDKDGAVACLLMSELAARLLAAGKSVHEKLDDLFWQHGVHTERLLTFQMEGSEGMAKMQRLMARLRERPPARMGGFSVCRRTRLPEPTDNLPRIGPAPCRGRAATW